MQNNAKFCMLYSAIRIYNESTPRIFMHNMGQTQQWHCKMYVLGLC